MPSPTSLAASVQQYQRAYDKALELFNVYDEAGSPELIRIQEALLTEVTSLMNVAGLTWDDCGNLGRHLSFLARYLARDEKQYSEQDAKDIVFFDLPEVLRTIVSKSADDVHLDARLRDAVVPLMSGGHYDSAVRKAFVILTDRLRRVFGVEAELDGDDLVNVVFGRGGRVPVPLDDSKRQAMRNLLSGFYGVYRNRFAHNDVQPDTSQARAIIEMANTLLHEVEALGRQSAGGA
jgi:hypothetical protein